MMFIQKALSLIVVLGVLVTIHELGHYLIARWCNVKVLRFSIGMGRVVWMRKFGADQTEWAISMLPLGGYVKMLDAREQGIENIPEEDKAREFCAQSVWKRIAIVAAGPIANFLLAILLYTVVFVSGQEEPVAQIRVADMNSLAYQSGMRSGDKVTEINGKSIESWSQLHWAIASASMSNESLTIQLLRPLENGQNKIIDVQIAASRIEIKQPDSDVMQELGISLPSISTIVLQGVLAGGPAEAAGLQVGDRILGTETETFADARAFTEFVSKHPEKTIQLVVLRDGRELSFNLKPKAEKVNGKELGRILVQLSPPKVETVWVKSDLPTALSTSFVKVWDSSILTFQMLGKMVIGEASIKNISGPITIADYAGQSASLGWVPFVMLMAGISISLGVMNLLPVPMLDGGHLLYYSVEILTGKPIPERIIEKTQQLGLVLLLSLMGLAFFNDITRLVS